LYRYRDNDGSFFVYYLILLLQLRSCMTRSLSYLLRSQNSSEISMFFSLSDETASRWLEKNNPYSHTPCSSSSGVVGACAVRPADGMQAHHPVCTSSGRRRNLRLIRQCHRDETHNQYAYASTYSTTDRNNMTSLNTRKKDKNLDQDGRKEKSSQSCATKGGISIEKKNVLFCSIADNS
jgi:hypothetical protein